MFWTANLWKADFSESSCAPWPYYSVNDACNATFTGRLLAQTSGRINTLGQGQCTWPLTGMQVMVTAVAVRVARPTTTRQNSWGSIKANYR